MYTILLHFAFATLYFCASVIGKPSDPHMMFEMDKAIETPDLSSASQDCQKKVSLQPQLNNSRYSLLHKQLVVSFWRQMSQSMSTKQNRDVYIYATLFFDSKMLQTLQRYLNSTSDNAEEVNNVFMHMFVNLSVDNPNQINLPYSSNHNHSLFEKVNTHFDSIFYVLLFLSSFYVIYLMFKSRQYWRIFLSWQVFIMVLFILSVIWNWIRLYKEAIANRHASIQTELSNHRECNGIQDINWLQSLKLWFNQQFLIKQADPCSEAVRKYLVDPFWDVTPLDAVSETLSRFVLYPSERLGESIGLLFQRMNGYLPIWMMPFASIFLLLFFVVLLAVIRGYSLRIPFLLHFEAPNVRKQQLQFDPHLIAQSPRGSHGDKHCKKYLKACHWKQQVSRHNRLHGDYENE